MVQLNGVVPRIAVPVGLDTSAAGEMDGSESIGCRAQPATNPSVRGRE